MNKFVNSFEKQHEYIKNIMKMKRISIILGALLCGMPMMAKVQPGSPITDNMVLQQNTKARLYGKAKAGAKVTATPSWNN